MDTTAQLRECVDMLENPEILEADLLMSIDAVEAGFHDGTLERESLTARADAVSAQNVQPEWMYEGRDLSVLGDSASFTCLSSNVDAIPPVTVAAKQQTEGFDFVGITCNALVQPVIGAVQSERDASAYPLLLRLLAGLVEMSPAEQLSRMKPEAFNGVLSPSPCLDLYVVTWYYDDTADRTPICEFTRDIAELAKRVIAEQSPIADLLNDVVCLRMNPARFDGRMRFDWRV